MKHTFKFRIFIMIFLPVLFSSCSRQIVVWSISDIIGLSLLGLCFAVFMAVFLFAWIQTTVKSFKAKKK